jgi:hypothetical protein
MSVKKDIFLEMSAYAMAKLQTYDANLHPQGAFTPEMALPGLAWFDKQMGQFTAPDLATAMPLPCILMEYQPFNWRRIGKGVQHGTGSIRLYIYFENYASSFNGSFNQQTALNFFMFTEQVNAIFEGYSIENKMMKLERISDNEDTAEDMIITSTVDYGTVIYDKSIATFNGGVPVDANLIVNKVDSTGRPARQSFIDGFVI